MRESPVATNMAPPLHLVVRCNLALVSHPSLHVMIHHCRLYSGFVLPTPHGLVDMPTILPPCHCRLSKVVVNRRYLGPFVPRPGSKLVRSRAMMMPDVDLASNLSGLVQNHGMLALAYEPVALPCSMMRCGDVVYRRCVILSAAPPWHGLPYEPLCLAHAAHWTSR